MYTHKALIGIVIALLLLSACRSADKTQLRNASDAFASLPESKDSIAFNRPGRELVFRGIQLNRLIDSALQNNPGYLQAMAEISKSHANLRFRRNAMLPTLDIQLQSGLRRFGEYTMDGVGNFDTRFSPNIRPEQIIPDPLPDYALLLRSNWELDIWGQLRNLKRGAAYRFQATNWMGVMVRTQLVADVSALYFEGINLASAIQVLESNARLQEKATEAMEVYYTAGRVPRLAVQQLDAQVRNTRALKAHYHRQWVKAQADLMLLTGSFRDTISETGSLNLDASINMDDVPLSPQVLLNRPDVLAAESTLMANGVEVKAARAALLPSIQINPMAGFNSFYMPRLFTPAAMVYHLFAGLTMPLFQQHIIHARIQTAKADAEIAFQRYRETLLTAYAELFSCVKTQRILATEQVFKREEVEILQAGVASALDLFTAGQITYLEVYSAQQNVLQAQLELQLVERDIALNQILLYRAIGGN
jgi:HAE1 family hydrophobic/amphiphilic exporter-1